MKKLLLISLLVLATLRQGSTVSLQVSSDAQWGDFLVDSNGMSLYGFQPDKQGASTCYGDCAAYWPPLLTSQYTAAGDTGIDSSLVGNTQRTDGTSQVTYNKWPLYYFSGDAAAGDTNGQLLVGFGGQWNLISPQGDLILANGETESVYSESGEGEYTETGEYAGEEGYASYETEGLFGEVSGYLL